MKFPAYNSATFEIIKAAVVGGISVVLANLVTAVTNNPDAFGPYAVIFVAVLQFLRAYTNPKVKNY